jgi:hypothetical protein
MSDAILVDAAKRYNVPAGDPPVVWERQLVAKADKRPGVL